MTWSCCIAVAVATLSVYANAAASAADNRQLHPLYAGFVWEIRGTAHLRTNERATATEILSEGTSRFRRLYDTTGIKCDPGGMVGVRMRYGGITNITSSVWVKTPLERAPDIVNTVEGEWIANALAPASVHRAQPGASSQLYFFQPTRDGRICAGRHAALRWPPLKSSEILEIKIVGGPAHLFQVDVPAAAGRYESESLRAFLSKASSLDESRSLKVVFRLKDGNHSEKAQGFEVLSSEEEQALARDLQQIDQSQDEPSRSLAKIGLLLSKKLNNQAADEFKSAISHPLFAQSPHFLAAAAEYMREIGDGESAQEIVKAVGSPK
jgi:hypothetical protein